MIIKEKKPLSSYKKYFSLYVSEAPGDDDEDGTMNVTVAPRANRGTDYGAGDNVTVRPRANRGTDYGAENEDDAPEEPAANDTPDTPAEDNPPDDAGDAPANDVTANPDDDTETDYTQDTDDPGAGDNPDEGGDEDTGDEGGIDDEDMGDEATDYTDDDDEDDDVDMTGDEDTGDEAGTEEDKTEQYNKFHMYRRYMNLYNTIDSFTEKLRNVVKDDQVQNAAVKVVSDNFNDVKDIMFDFMTVKYKSSTYLQIRTFFETIITIIKLNFELLSNNNVSLR